MKDENIITKENYTYCGTGNLSMVRQEKNKVKKNASLIMIFILKQTTRAVDTSVFSMVAVLDGKTVVRAVLKPRLVAMTT